MSISNLRLDDNFKFLNSSYKSVKIVQETLIVETEIFETKESKLLVKFYKNEISTADLQKEKKFVNLFLLNGEISLKIIEKNLASYPNYLVYALEDFLPLSVQIKSIPLRSRTILASNLIKAVEQIHLLKIIHSNLNLENILINEKLEVKVIGFEDCLESDEVTEKRLDHFKSQLQSFKAPELLRSGYDIGFQVDTWSLGCVLFKVFYPDRQLEEFDEGNKLLVDSIEDPKLHEMFQIIFHADPIMRCAPSYLNSLLLAPYLKPVFKNSNKPTAKLTKEFLIDKSRSINTNLIKELVLRIKEDNTRVQKFKITFLERRFRNPKKILRGLFLLHRLWNDLQIKDCSPENSQLFGRLINFLNRTDLAEYYDIIKTYVKVINKKICLAFKYMLKHDDYQFNKTDQKEKNILKYLKAAVEMISLIIFTDADKEFFKAIVFTILEEVLDISRNLISNFDDLVKKKSFLCLRAMTGEIMQEVYRIYKYPELSYQSPMFINCNIQMIGNDCIFNKFLIKDKEQLNSFSNYQTFRASYKNHIIGLKTLNLSETSERNKRIKREINSSTILKNEHLLKYLSCFINEKIVIVHEFCQGGSLKSLLETGIRLTLTQKIKILLDVAKALDYLHSMAPPVLHRNLNTSCILLTSIVSNQEKLPNAKVAEFEFGQFLDYEQNYANICKDWQNYTKKHDVYQFGVLFMEIFQRRMQSERQIDFHSKKNNISFDSLGNDVPDDINQLASQCLNFNSDNRPTFRNIVQKLEEIFYFNYLR